MYFTGKSGLEDEEFEQVFAYGDLEPVDNFKCGMLTDDIELPQMAIEDGTEPTCCVEFEISALRHIFCSTKMPLCGLEIRRLARFIKIQCLLHFHESTYDPQTAPSAEDLDKVAHDGEKSVKWEGWGYYYALTKSTFHLHRPYYFKVGKEVKIAVDPTALEQAEVFLTGLTFSCAPDKFCKVDEFAGKAAELGDAINAFKLVYEKTALKEKPMDQHCFVVEESVEKAVLCVHKEGALVNFEQTLLLVHSMNEVDMQIDKQSPLAVNEKYKGVLFVDKALKNDGELTVNQDNVEFSGEPPHQVKYTDIEMQQGDVCAVKVKGLTLPDAKIAEVPHLQKECCLEIKTKEGKLANMCIHKDEPDCPKLVRKLARRMKMNCLGSSMSPDKIKDLEVDTKDRHEEGRWSGWVFHAEVSGATALPTKEMVYLDINPNKELVSIGPNPRVIKKDWKLYDMLFPCGTNGPCKIEEWANLNKLDGFQKAMDKVARDNFEAADSRNCYIIKFQRAKGPTTPLLNMFCIIDVNQFESVAKAVDKGFTKTITKTSLMHVKAAEDAEKFEIVWQDTPG